MGSLSGLVRVYTPKPVPFDPEHLVLEKQLPHPVVQLESGLLLPYVHVYDAFYCLYTYNVCRWYEG